MEEPDSTPRVRKWDAEVGFINLFQGRDLISAPDAYPGDRGVHGLDQKKDQIIVQIHRVVRRDWPEDPDDLFTLAVHIGERKVAKLRSAAADSGKN